MSGKRTFGVIVLSLAMLLMMAGAAHAVAVPIPSIYWDPAVGGNGHYYEDVAPGGIGWTACRDQAILRTFVVNGTTYRGHLVTITSALEQDFLVNAFNLTVNSTRYWAGGYQPPGSEVWYWVTGEPWGYTCWYVPTGEPNNSYGTEDALELWGGDRDGYWNDLTRSETYITNYLCEYEVDRPPTIGSNATSAVVIEGHDATMSGSWNDEAPPLCTLSVTGRGTVTKGGGWWTWSYPTTEGPLTDAVTITINDTINPPVSCSFSLTVRPATPTSPVEWNGHFYEGVPLPGGSTWDSARTLAAYRTFVHDGVTYRGHLATVTSADEQNFLMDRFNMAYEEYPNYHHYWIGGIQTNNVWYWVTGEPWSYTCWYFSPGSGSNRVEMYPKPFNGYWRSSPYNESWVDYYMVEYELPTIASNTASVTVNEGQTATMSGTWTGGDLTNSSRTVTANIGSLIPGQRTWTWSYPTTDGPAQSQTVTITINDGSASASCNFTLTVNNVAPSVGAITGPGATVGVDTPVNVSASFTDPGTADTHTASWNWGDGNTTSGTVTGSGGSGTATGTHTYSSPRTYTITLTVTDKDGANGSRIYTQQVNTPPTIAADAASVAVDEGAAAAMTGTWSDDGPFASQTFSANVGTVTGAAGGTWSWLRPTTDGPAQSQTVTITINDGSASTSCTFTLTVNNVAPSVGAITGPGVTVGTGTPVNVSAPFTDPGTLDTRTATWNWGDGNTSSGTISGTTGSGTVTGAHTYTSSGTYTITLTVTDKDRGSGSSTYTQSVNTPPTISSSASSVTVGEGTTATMTGTWSDDGAFASQTFTASVGTITGAAGGTWSWSCPTTDGPQSQTVTITINDGLTSTSCSFTLTVNNVAPSIGTITGPAGRVEVNASVDMSATFTDPGTADTHTATWAWGDGNTSNGTVSETGGSGSVTGTHQYAAPGDYTISLTLTDKDSGSDTHTYSQHINAPPTVTKSTESVTVNEGTTATMAGTWSDDDPFASQTFTASVGTITGAAGGTWSWSYATIDGPTQSQTVTITISDSSASTTCTFPLTVNNVVPSIGTITGPLAPVALGVPVNMSVTFTDPGTGDTHTAAWFWGYGSTTSPGTVSEASGAGTATGSHTYPAPGVYTVSVQIIDDDHGSCLGIYTGYVVVYDTSAGFVTGGGWINSPPGAYTADPTLSGRATFGFVAKYKPGAVAPAGTTEFRFNTGNLYFESTSYEWLVVAGSKAQFKGTGTINGAGTYKFMLSAIDSGKGETDTFRIKITSGDSVVYDNLAGAAETANPTTTLGGGNIVIHK